MVALYIILGVIAAFVAVILIRTAAFKPKPIPDGVREELDLDRERAVHSLAELIKCRTVSHTDSSLDDESEFEKLRNKLPELYPNVFNNCMMQYFADRAILIHWQGKSQGDPAVMMSHYDVVPADEENWDKPPFEGIIEDGVLWGRGAIDTKVTMNAALFAADYLIGKGFVPENDVYFAFSGVEEVNGPGADHIVDWFAEQGITPGIVVDEGGGVVRDAFPGVKEPCAMVGIAEKGLLNIEYTVNSNGGHASTPPPHTPVGKLAKACAKIEAHPCKMHITKPVAEMFDTLGRYSTFVYRMIFANLWCFKGALDLMARKSGGEMNALLRTTVAFTQMSGSKAPNIIPPQAKMVSNSRINPDDSAESVVEYFKSVIDDEEVQVVNFESNEPSRISCTDCVAFEKMSKAIRDTWEGSIVSPYLMVQCSDSRFYGRISDKVYRFSALDLTLEERRGVHGNNERVRTAAVERSAEFYIRLLKQC